MISFQKTELIYKNLVMLLITFILCHQSLVPLVEPINRTRQFTRQIEFDTDRWTASAVAGKILSALDQFDQIVPMDAQKRLVLSYINKTREKQDLEGQIRVIYSDPSIKDPIRATQALSTQLSRVESDLMQISPTVERILEDQTASAIQVMGLSTLGISFPPVSFHVTPLPLALIISPRNIIRQDGHISINPNLSLPQQIELEDKVSSTLNYSTLVEEVGGLGTYPTMVQQTSDLNWLLEVIAHEWTHNYLSLHPLGLSYDVNSELRTINETTASIAGKEISRQVLRMYYPELLPPDEPPKPEEAQPSVESMQPAVEEYDPGKFDFQTEMHVTRVTADELLAAGKITEAEAYMEARRQVFWNNGYAIRKLNQAYFAFHGAYADTPGGAAGEDPVGASVRSLRADSKNLADFIHTIAMVHSYDELKTLLITPKP